MPYELGSCSATDNRWLAFYNTSRFSNDDKRAWLKAGHPPFALLEQADACSAGPVGRDPVYWGRWPVPPLLVHIGEPEYPPLLAACDDAPPLLFTVGDLAVLSRPTVAIVGTRQPSADGLRAARQAAETLSCAGFSVLSGLARGIDGAVHEAVVAAGQATVAVMATGIDRIYPSRHKRLADSIVKRGLLVTEFAPGSVPYRWHFPRRNRTLSGLALGTVVVEAGRPSGSLLTATAAAEQGREVFAYPWSIFHKGGAGCHYLLTNGAQLACSARDIADGLAMPIHGLFALPARHPENMPPVERQGQLDLASPSRVTGAMTRLQSRVVGLVGDGVIDAPELARLLGRSVPELTVQLTELELSGHVASGPEGYRLVR